MKHQRNHRESADDNEAFARAFEAVPRVDDLGLPIEDGLRRVAAGLALGGFRVSRLSESGEDGSVAYPYIEVEPIAERKEREFYLRALKRRDEFGADILSDRENAAITEMEAYLDEQRVMLNETLSALVEEFYAGRDADSIEGVERLEALQNEQGVDRIVPAGAKTMRDKEESGEMDDQAKKERERLFAGEIQRFGGFLAERFTR